MFKYYNRRCLNITVSEGVGEAVLVVMQQFNGNVKCHLMMAAFSHLKLFITSLCIYSVKIVTIRIPLVVKFCFRLCSIYVS